MNISANSSDINRFKRYRSTFASFIVVNISVFSNLCSANTLKLLSYSSYEHRGTVLHCPKGEPSIQSLLSPRTTGARLPPLRYENDGRQVAAPTIGNVGGRFPCVPHRQRQ
jgi:hypothetical protein